MLLVCSINQLNYLLANQPYLIKKLDNIFFSAETVHSFTVLWKNYSNFRIAYIILLRKLTSFLQLLQVLREIPNLIYSWELQQFDIRCYIFSQCQCEARIPHRKSGEELKFLEEEHYNRDRACDGAGKNIYNNTLCWKGK